MKKNYFLVPILFSILFLSFFLQAFTQEPPLKLKVVSELANLRENPEIGSPLIYQAPKGTILESRGKEGKWYIVEYKPEEGEPVTCYVHESLVMEIKKPEEEEKEEIIEPVKKEQIRVIPKIKPEKPIEKPEKKTEEIPIIQQPPSTVQKRSQPKINLFLSGGVRYFPGGDLNTGSQGLADFYEDDLGVQGEGDVKSLHLSYIFGGELSFALSSKFWAGVGTGYFLGDKGSTVNFQTGSLQSSLTTNPKIEALPLRLFLSFYPVSPIFIKAEIEYYFAKCAYSYKFQQGDALQEWNGDATAQGIGLGGGIGIDINIVSGVSFVMEATYRYAKIKNFKGTGRYINIEGQESTEDGTLYIYDGKVSQQKYFPLLFILENEPTEPVGRDAKPATIDLSGTTLKIGLRIRF